MELEELLRQRAELDARIAALQRPERKVDTKKKQPGKSKPKEFLNSYKRLERRHVKRKQQKSAEGLAPLASLGEEDMVALTIALNDLHDRMQWGEELDMADYVYEKGPSALAVVETGYWHAKFDVRVS